MSTGNEPRKGVGGNGEAQGLPLSLAPVRDPWFHVLWVSASASVLVSASILVSVSFSVSSETPGLVSSGFHENLFMTEAFQSLPLSVPLSRSLVRYLDSWCLAFMV